MGSFLILVVSCKELFYSMRRLIHVFVAGDVSASHIVVMATKKNFEFTLVHIMVKYIEIERFIVVNWRYCLFGLRVGRDLEIGSSSKLRLLIEYQKSGPNLSC